MTFNEVYIRISCITKALHWLSHFVLDTLLIQDISYQTYVNVVDSSLHKLEKGLWPPFPLSTRVYKIENIKQDKEEVSILSSFIFKEVTF